MDNYCKMFILKDSIVLSRKICVIYIYFIDGQYIKDLIQGKNINIKYNYFNCLIVGAITHLYT